MRAFEMAAKQLWAIEVDPKTGEAPALANILDIAQRAHNPDFEAVAQKMAERTDEAGILDQRGPVAVLNVTGPIFRYANLFTWISGATSVQEMATAFRAAVEDPKTSAIVLNIDSPGGEVAGISELAQAIYEARSSKPIVAYADDLTASGAYWLASAASRIVASDTAELGSIGVVATVIERAPKDGAKQYQFVSSISPKKRPKLDTEEGQATIQQRIDDLASVFVSAVARNRGVPEQKVLSDFGQGGVLIASKAIAAGMADSTGTFEGLLGELAAASQMPRSIGGITAMKGVRMDTSVADKKTAEPGVIQGISLDLGPIKAEERAAGKAEGKTEGIKEGVASERERIGAILSCDEAKGREATARTLAIDTDLDLEAARKVLAATPAQTANHLASAMTGVPNPSVGVGSGEATEEEALVKGVLAFANKGRK